MMIAMKKNLLVFSTVLALLCLEASLFGQLKQGNSEHNLLDQKLTVCVKSATFVYVLATLAQDHGIRIGLEVSSADKGEAKLDVDVKDVPLRDVLDSITRQEPNYQWEVRDGVINFTPTRDRYAFIATLLNTPVHHYSPARKSDEFELRNNILQLPEVRSLMTTNGIKFYKFTDMFPNGENNEDNNVDLSISNTTVRGVLNRVIRDSRYKTWILNLAENGDLVLSF